MAYGERRVFHAIDLDRTLLDTPRLTTDVINIVEAYDSALASEMRTDEVDAQIRGESPPIYSRIAARFGEKGLHEIMASVKFRDELLLPGARERLAYTRSRQGWSGGIMTYGDETVQNWKLSLLGLEHEAHLVVDTRRKGALIASWALAEGGIQLPDAFGGVVVDTVVLDDDRAVAFEGLPDFCYGNWVHPVVAENEDSMLPPSVRRVDDLHGSIVRLENIL